MTPASTLETSIGSRAEPRLEKVDFHGSNKGSVSESELVDNNPIATSPADDLAHGNDNFHRARDAKNDAVISSATIEKKSTGAVKRTMTLTGLPPPALPPRPVFPADLEHYQIHGHGFGGTALYSQQMQAYLSDLRTDYKRQLKTYEKLQQLAIEDTSYATAIVDELDAMDEDPFTLDSFENLMRLHASKDKDFIIARVTTQDPNEESKLYHSYYSAHQINKVLFRTQPDEGLLHRMKARNPLNNMLVVGDVHYYSIKAKDVQAIKPLKTARSSASSISSHSSRMSRCSKLAAQAIVVGQSAASARSSPILGSDSSLFCRSNGVQSPISTNSPPMALSMQMAHGNEEGENTTVRSVGQATRGPSPVANRPPTPGTKHKMSGPSSPSSPSTSSVGSQSPSIPNGSQPCRPSRLRQAIDPEAEDDHRRAISGEYGPSTPPPNGSQHSHHGHHHQAQSPLFQTLMGGRIRNRSNTISSISSDRSISSVASRGSCTSSCSASSCTSGCSVCQRAATSTTTTAAAAAAATIVAVMIGPDSSSSSSRSSFPSNRSDDSSYQDTPTSPSLSATSSTSSSFASSSDSDEPALYQFKYLASDDDFLLRSSVRQIFKDNALETWDAVLFTISQNALREYATAVPGEEPVQQLLSLHLQEQYQQEMEQQQQQQQHQQELLQLQIRQQQQLLEEQQTLMREQQVQHQRAQEETAAAMRQRRQQQEQAQQGLEAGPDASTSTSYSSPSSLPSASQEEMSGGQLGRQRSKVKMGSILKIFGRGGGEKR